MSARFSEILSAQFDSHNDVQRLLGDKVLEPKRTSGLLLPKSFSPSVPAFPVLRMSLVSTMAMTILVMQYVSPAAGSRGIPPSSISSSPVSVFHAAASSRRERMSLPPEPPLQSISSESSESSQASASIVAEESASSDPASSESSGSLVAPPRFDRFDNKTGVYLTASSIKRTEFLDTTIQSLLDSGGNTLVFDVKGSAVMFHSAAPMANDVGLVLSIYELPVLLAKLHEKNIYTIGRFVAIKDSGITKKLPETQIKHPKTGKSFGGEWVDPSNETAIQYNMEVMCELAAAGIDEINLDYIRFSTANFGALSVFSGDEKADHVEVFLKASRETIDRCGPNTRLGISTYAILGWDYKRNVETLGQDVIRFAPLVDVISPMAYPATFTSAGYYIPGKNPGPRMYWLVYRTLKGYADMLGPEHAQKIRPWIQGYGVGRKDVSDQIRAVYDAGACGFQVWNAGNNYAPSYAAFKADTLRPERCKDVPTVPGIPPLSF